MRNIFLLILAIIGLIILSPPIFTVRIFQRRFNLSTYAYSIAKNIDYLGGTIIDGTDGHTISANSSHFNIGWRVKFINWMFRDKNHCKEAYLYEYIEKLKEGVI